jgi:hypothetical protein
MAQIDHMPIKCSVDLISDVLPFGRLLYCGSEPIRNAIGYARFYSRAYNAAIRGYDAVADPPNERSASILRSARKAGECSDL